jgi:hypothetical protein
MNIGFLGRAIIYNTSLVDYGDVDFVDLVHNDITMVKFIDFQNRMLVCSIFNWILNMVFDAIVLKMYCVYSTFHAESREKSILIAKKINFYIKCFYILYLGFGLLLNIRSFNFLELYIQNF